MPARQQAAFGAWETPRRFIVHNRHEHIQAAAVRTVATKGYLATRERDICDTAHVSLRCFHEHFRDKEQAVLSGVEAGVDQVMGFCQEVYRSSPTWTDAIWDGMSAYAEWARAEPEFARTGFVELLSIGPAALELLRSLMDAFAIFLKPGYELLEPAAAGSLDEPICQRVFELLHLHVSHQSPETIDTLVPELVRTALTPFLGPHAAEEFIAYRESSAAGLARPALGRSS
jgi:AcrR family transcriptional regulator